MSNLKVAIAGLGTVGAGVVKLLKENKAEIEAHTGHTIEVVAVSARNKNKDRGIEISGLQWFENPLDIANAEADVIVELMGGEGDPAYSLVKRSLENGKAVITANKALLACCGLELAKISEENKAPLMFEAAIAGGIPIVKMLREGLAANKIKKLYGILNGTCNYILSTMEDTGRDFDDVLKEAQEKGYAEAEPSLDVDGGDTAHKLSLLTALAFGVVPDIQSVSISGIRMITAQDIQSADELGYRIKLLGQADMDSEGRIIQVVEACLIPKTASLANVHGVLNAVYTEGNYAGSSFIEGRGAGAGPTASAVVADLIDLARNNTTAPFGRPVQGLKKAEMINPEEKTGEYYIRLDVLDQPGVIADVAAILRDYNISIESLIQRGRDPGQKVSVVLTTHEAKRRNLNEAAKMIEALASVSSAPVILQRILL
ncbi:MAG: homoserine dehydrogenase [Micavibrio aeruginosavorus]|uniref:Homoserine dehydrogenase n=1 Tax=Micavibrio aeruginosavorus TaxID=349221 RepID=A0A2W5FLI3_9BACT|nr:MAG: homoserine dehydrogenase [Micavibrio aeruginosavorus]